MYKSIIVFVVTGLLFVQCGSTPAASEEIPIENQEIMELRNPAFAKAKTTFYKWIAGVQGGGAGITMEFEWVALPENLVMKDAYFREMNAKLQPKNSGGYQANFISDQNKAQDLIMHSDPEKEAANTPPIVKPKFPEPLKSNQVGIIYEENGKTVYTIINNPEEKPQVAYPSASHGERH